MPRMKVSDIAQKLGLKALNEFIDREVEGVYISDMVSDIITGPKANSILITLQTNKSIIAAANLVDVATIVFARNKKPGDDIIALAAKAGIGLFVTELDTWSFAMKLADIGIK
jgi:hypothetical protein